MPRCFIAINLPPETRKLAAAIRDSLKGSVGEAPIKWTSDANMHLTLRFLGSVGDDRLPLLQEELDSIARRHKAVQIATARLGAFPSLREPRVLWLGLEEPVDDLMSLQADIEACVAPLVSHEESRRYHPHLTLGQCKRLDRIQSAAIRQSIKGSETPRATWKAEAFELMVSKLGTSGSLYSVLQSCLLEP